MKPAGNPNIIPSILSRTPPCPGKRLPVSFFFAFLLRKEKNKSPTWQKNEVINPVDIIIELIFFVIRKNKQLNVKQLSKKDPADPEIVLLGLIFVIFGPLNILPKIYPPISEDIQVSNNVNSTILNWITFERIKNREKKININTIKDKLYNNLGRNFLLILSIILVNSIIEKAPIIINKYIKTGFDKIIKHNNNNKKKDVNILFLKFSEII